MVIENFAPYYFLFQALNSFSTIEDYLEMALEAFKDSSNKLWNSFSMVKSSLGCYLSISLNLSQNIPIFFSKYANMLFSHSYTLVLTYSTFDALYFTLFIIGFLIAP